jgi:hypothetical protein
MNMQDPIQKNLSIPDTSSGIQQVDSINLLHDTLIPPEVQQLKEKIITPKILLKNPVQFSSKGSDSLTAVKKTDSVEQQQFITEQKVIVSLHNDNSFISRNISSDRFPDWYFILIISVLFTFAWIRIVYSRFLTTLFESSYNYLLASKIFKERGVVQKRVGMTFNLIYQINGSLFLFLLFHFFKWNPLGLNDFALFSTSFGFLSCLMLIRIITMRVIGHIFDRFSLFSEFLYNFYIYNKLLGLVLLPFLLSIPYTQGILHVILIYTALFVIGVVYLMRLIRIIIFTFKNVILLFYLILYLCTLEILPVLVIIKLILSLT